MRYVKRGMNNHSLLDVGGTSNLGMELGSLGLMYLGWLPCEKIMNSKELGD